MHLRTVALSYMHMHAVLPDLHSRALGNSTLLYQDCSGRCMHTPIPSVLLLCIARVLYVVHNAITHP